MEETKSRTQRLTSLWSLLQFPIISLILIAGIFWLSLQQNQLYLQQGQQQQHTALQIAADQQRETALLNYMDSISSMMANNKLLEAKATDDVKLVANARTLEVLSKLDPDRKAVLMRFLYNTKLINNDHMIISMIDADLSNSHLRNADLRDTYLLGINFSGADLRGINLSYATLIYANFTNANLAGADLHASDMHNVNLTGANLTGANLKDVLGLDDTLLARAKSLAGATMPDGTVHS